MITARGAHDVRKNEKSSQFLLLSFTIQVSQCILIWKKKLETTMVSTVISYDKQFFSLFLFLLHRFLACRMFSFPWLLVFPSLHIMKKKKLYRKCWICFLWMMCACAGNVFYILLYFLVLKTWYSNILMCPVGEDMQKSKQMYRRKKN